MKLTAATIAKITLPPNKQEAIIYDDEIAGFGVRMREGGSRNFIYQYRIGAQNRRLTLGAAVPEAFPDIRKRVLELQAKVRLGEDPALAKEAGRKQAGETFKVMAERYLAHKLEGDEAEDLSGEQALSPHPRPAAACQADRRH